MRDRNAPLTEANIAALAWDKMDGLIPAIVQDCATRQTLMLGYMNRAALDATLGSGFATFYSRSKARLWEKGETSGNRLSVKAIFADCDGDALLVEAEPAGPICHLGSTSCFGVDEAPGVGFLARLGRVVHDRAEGGDPASYTASLLAEGLPRIAQKIGEEGVEVALAAVTRDRAGCIEEVADLAYHLTVLMEAKGFDWGDVADTLRKRHAD